APGPRRVARRPARRQRRARVRRHPGGGRDRRLPGDHARRDARRRPPPRRAGLRGVRGDGAEGDARPGGPGPRPLARRPAGDPAPHRAGGARRAFGGHRRLDPAPGRRVRGVPLAHRRAKGRGARLEARGLGRRHRHVGPPRPRHARHVEAL
ncbi:MAG: Molybdopterin synthase catalytic subunit MoaE, partial [uncultured Phycisphaerae bacterium]